MLIEKRKIVDLKPAPYNPRQSTKDQEYHLSESLKKFGCVEPIIINCHEGRENIIVGGHFRVRELKKLGQKEVDCVIVDLDEEAERELNIRLNANTGSWDYDILANEWEIEDLNNWGLDIPDFSKTEQELIEEVEEDKIPEQTESKVKLGDIWQLGNHRLMCGDSTNENDVFLLMNNEKADMIYTDMPYGMNLDTDYSILKHKSDFNTYKNIKGGKKYNKGKVDDFSPEMIQVIFGYFNYVKEIFLFGADYFAEYIPNKNEGSWIVWDKRANGNDDIEQDNLSDKMYGSCFELCWSKNRHKRDIVRIKWAGVFGVEKEFDKKRYHPTQKPILLGKWFIDKYSKENNIVLDLFGGSGSTLIACEQLNRRCYIMELDKHYCDVIITRWENLTGQKAIKIN